jgi:hypothetical protein
MKEGVMLSQTNMVRTGLMMVMYHYRFVYVNNILCITECDCPCGLEGQSSWLQIQRSGFDSQLYQIFWELVGLEWCPFSLMSTTEELLGRKSSGSSPEIQKYGHGDPSRWPCGTLYPQKLALTSPTSGGHSVRIVCSQTQAMEFSFSFITECTACMFQAYGHYQEASLHLRHALELKPEFEPALAALKDMESLPDTTIHIYTLLIIICLVWLT